jgi:hypothetical protein
VTLVPETCFECQGSGKCEECNGSRLAPGEPEGGDFCRRCDNTGHCLDCMGRGVVDEEID